MTGTTGDLIPIIIVPALLLAFCLIMIFYADRHPRWGNQAPADTVSANALEGSVPAQHLAGPGPVVPGQRRNAVADDVPAEQTQASEIRRE